MWVGLAREKIHTWMMLISYDHHHDRHSYMHELPNGDLTRHGGLKVSFLLMVGFWEETRERERERETCSGKEMKICERNSKI